HLARARARNRRAVASRTRTLGNQLRTDRARQHRRRTPRPRTHPTAQTTTSGLDREALARSGSVKDVSALIRKGCFRLRNVTCPPPRPGPGTGRRPRAADGPDARQGDARRRRTPAEPPATNNCRTAPPPPPHPPPPPPPPTSASAPPPSSPPQFP